jgi:hypothetical protein
MSRVATAFAAILLLGAQSAAQAGIISALVYTDDAAFSAATGATSLTGPLPDLGDVGTSVTLGDATLTTPAAENTMFIGTGWSTLLPNQRAIAISGTENLTVSLNSGPATAFGFYFHQPIANPGRLDGCNTTCVDSEFDIAFYFGGLFVDSVGFTPGDGVSFGGIILDHVFDEVRFVETVGTNDNEFYGEMFVARVPEPGTLALLGAGLAAVGFTRRRRARG